MPTHRALVDIRRLEVNAGCYGAAMCVYFDIAASPEEAVNDPATQWVAYGVMVDRDGDGVADIQAGIDNASDGPRAWWTNIHTDETFAADGMRLPDLSVDGQIGWLVEEGAGETRGWVGVDESLADPLLHFYLWAALISDGDVVSVDFAPDDGWLDGYEL